MNQLAKITLPSSFYPSPFFSNSQTIELKYTNQLSDVIESPFVYDLLHQSGLSDFKPWDLREKTVPYLFEEWEKNNQTLSSLFSARKRKEAKPIALTSLALFLMALNWVNEKPVESLINLEEYVKTLKIKPVNCIERLTYALNAPDHYHSYIQLTQLFEELNKQFQKSLYMQKK